MKKIIYFLSIIFTLILCSCKQQPISESIIVEETNNVTITFNVDIPNPNDSCKYIIYGSFSEWEADENYTLKKENGKYVIKLKMEKDTTVTYKYGIIDRGELREERDINNRTIDKRQVVFDIDKMVDDTVKKFYGLSVATDKNMLDNTFYDNDGGEINTIDFSDGVMKVNYKKQENQSDACVVRNFTSDEIGKICKIKIEFLGEANGEYLFKLEGGDSDQEVIVTGTGNKEIITIDVNSSAINSKKFAIFANPGKPSSEENLLSGYYEIHSITLTLKAPDLIPLYVPGDNPIHILGIGNSYMDDSLWNIIPLLKEKYDDIDVTIVFAGGCSIDRHLANLDGNKSQYEIHRNIGNGWEIKKNKTIQDAIKLDNWDHILFIQGSGDTGSDHGLLESYYNLPILVNKVKELNKNENTKYYFIESWTDKDGDMRDYETARYGTADNMYLAIDNVVNEYLIPYILANNIVDDLIPNGKIIQQAKETIGIDKLYRDTNHLSMGVGRDLASKTVLEILEKNK